MTYETQEGAYLTALKHLDSAIAAVQNKQNGNPCSWEAAAHGVLLHCRLALKAVKQLGGAA